MLKLLLIVLCFITPSFTAFAAAGSVCFTVAPGGSDAGDGSVARPFATLARARDAGREAVRRGEEVTVVLRGGVYELPATLQFDARDSGRPGHPVVWRAAASEEVRISGGRAVEGWHAVSDPAMRAVLDPSARDRVLELSLKACSVTDYGDMRGGFGQVGTPGLEVFADDVPMHVARYPNTGFITITQVLGATPVAVRGDKGTKEGVFRVADPRVAQWAGQQDARVFGYWFYDWAAERQTIASVDPTTLTITLKGPPWPAYGYRKGQYFYGYNLPGEIDEPGEWYLNRETGMLYLLPPGGRTPKCTVVSLLPAIFSLKGTSRVVFKNLIFEAARGHALVATDCDAVALEHCTLRNCGGWGVIVAGGKQCAIRDCEISGMGDGGVSLEGGDRATLTPCGHVVTGCHIHDYSRWDRSYEPGIRLEGVGCRAIGNHIDHAPHQAIAFQGNDQVIAGNELDHVCEESNDAGAIYAWNDWAARGNRITGNYLHDIQGFEGKGARGVYLDDQFSSAVVAGNVFVRVAGAIQIGGGRDIKIEDNVFVDCRDALSLDARGLNWRAFGFEELKEKLERWPYKTPPWSVRYPTLPGLLADEPMAPKGTTVVDNLVVASGWKGIMREARPYLTVKGNVVEDGWAGAVSAVAQRLVRRQ